MAKIEITQPAGSGGTVNTGVLQIEGGGPITNSSQRITDQSGNTSPLYISSTALVVTTPTSTYASTRVIIQGTSDSAGYILVAVNRTGLELFNIKDDGSVLSTGPLTISTIANATTDTDKFLVSDAGVIKYRTANELLSDLGFTGAPVYGGGTATRLAFWSGTVNASSSTLTSSSALNWDDPNGRLGLGMVNPSARLQIRGDGVADTVRFESSVSTNLFTLSDQGRITAFAPATTALTGTTEIIKSTSSFIAPSAGSGSFRPLSIAYTINNTGAQTGTATGIFLSATETALGGMTHNLLNFQVGAFNVFTVSRSGVATTLGGVFSYGTIEVTASQCVSANGAAKFGAGGSNAASAILQADSTTRGFLPPRMTTTEKNAIASPAAGLIVYDTTLGKLAVRTASAWEIITSA
jgi:hypothetical protein